MANPARSWLLLALLVTACGPVELDFVTDSQSQDRHTWRCPDDTFVSEMSGSSVSGSPYQIAIKCLGLTTSCPNVDDGEADPGSGRCNDTIFTESCVDRAFVDFDPVGACTSHGEDGAEWANGARFDGSRENGIAYDSEGEVAFVVERRGVLDYTYAIPIR